MTQIIKYPIVSFVFSIFNLTFNSNPEEIPYWLKVNINEMIRPVINSVFHNVLIVDSSNHRIVELEYLFFVENLIP